MKNRMLYPFSFLILAALFLGSCQKGLLSKATSTGNLKTDSNATVSTIYGGFYSYVAPDKSGDFYATSVTINNDTLYKFTAVSRSAFYISPTTLNNDTVTHHTLGCLTTDSLGNVYVVDYNNGSATNVIKITSSGSASTLFSNISPAGINKLLKIAVDASGNLYYLDQLQQVHKITASGEASIAVSNAAGFAIDKYGDIVYINSQSAALQKLTPSGVNSTIVGLSTAISSPAEVTIDNLGNIYAGVSADHMMSIIKINTNNVASVVISSSPGYNDGPVKTANIGYPYSLVADASGNLYFCNQGPNFIRKITFQ